MSLWRSNCQSHLFTFVMSPKAAALPALAPKGESGSLRNWWRKPGVWITGVGRWSSVKFVQHNAYSLPVGCTHVVRPTTVLATIVTSQDCSIDHDGSLKLMFVGCNLGRALEIRVNLIDSGQGISGETQRQGDVRSQGFNAACGMGNK